jgi:hypothetical protein
MPGSFHVSWDFCRTIKASSAKTSFPPKTQLRPDSLNDMPAGRPRKILDATRIIKLASNGMTMREIAAFCDVSEDTLRANYSGSIKKGHELRNASLRKRQFDLAMAGNATMLVWLGKQYLGQADKIEQREEVKVEYGNLLVSREFVESRTADKPN